MSESRFFSRLEHWLRANPLAWSEIRARKSWLRSTRLHFGLRGLDLASRLGVSPARVSMMERDEDRGAVTLKMMQKAAQALDCEFVYLLVPKNTLPGEAVTQKPRLRVHPASTED